MPRKATEKSALTVSRMNAPGLHAVGGVSGLYLQVKAPGARSWILRVMVGEKRREIGLGGFPDVPLAQAKEKAREACDKIRQGIDPIEEKRAAKSALRAKQAMEITFMQAASKLIESKKAQWRNPKHIAQWGSTLETYAFPVVGEMQIQHVELAHILQILEPIWITKTETASRLRGRIENVLDWATVHGYRKGSNPAKWKGHLDKILPQPSKVAKVEHHDALPYDEIGDFMVELRQREGIGARCLEFAILTAARSGEARGTRWEEIDMAKATWTVPAERMKMNREHRVPLSQDALKLLESIPRTESPLVFASPQKEGILSDMTLSAILKRMEVNAVPHGFRSTFRDWTAEQTAYPTYLANQALAHGKEDKVDEAYQRGDLFDKRRRLMADWANFCAEPKTGKVVPICRDRA